MKHAAIVALTALLSMPALAQTSTTRPGADLRAGHIGFRCRAGTGGYAPGDAGHASDTGRCRHACHACYACVAGGQ